MRIAIVTQPLMSNYGGLLQNWALQTVLKREFPCADVLTFDQVDSVAPLYLRLGSKVKRFLLRRKQEHVNDQFDVFRLSYIHATVKSRSYKGFVRMHKKYAPDVYIVGSDQVWRPSMVFSLDANFLAFANKTKKIAYAASFGIDSWEFTKNETDRCRNYIQDFKGVSVREKDGVELCARHLGCSASHVLDPTLLLSKDDYETLIAGQSTGKDKYCFTYILDTTNAKREIVKSITGTLPEHNAAYNIQGIQPAERMSVERWLCEIKEADKVICDSFHGAAFAIIFNKDFYILANQHRGNSRLRSLLSLFGLTNRMVSTVDEIRSIPPIDWSLVNKRRADLISDSLSFLHTHID